MTGNYFSPNAGDSIIVRLKIDRQGQTLAQITTKIAELSGVDMRQATNISEAILYGTIMCRTIMPDGKENNSNC